jgi:hypothetical protein
MKMKNFLMMSLLALATSCKTKEVITTDKFKSWCYERLVNDTEFKSLSHDSKVRVKTTEDVCKKD